LTETISQCWTSLQYITISQVDIILTITIPSCLRS